jgi:hypothetical protein
MTISATAITIDGDTAWWVIDLKTAWRRKHDNRPCDTCDGTGHATFGNQVRTSEECHDCDGSKRHTFNIHLSEGQHETLSVHVVAELEIGDDHTFGEGFLYGGKHFGPNWIVVGGGLDQPYVTLPADAAPGMYAVRLAVHT